MSARGTGDDKADEDVEGKEDRMEGSVGNGGKWRPSEAQELVATFANLDDKVKQEVVSKLVRDNLHNEAKNAAVAEAVRSTSDGDTNDVVATAVRTAPIEAKKAAVAEAVESAANGEKQQVTAQAVRVAPLEAKKAAVAEAVRTAVDGDKAEVVTEAVRTAPVEAKKAAAAEAVESASREDKKDVAREAMESLSTKDQKELASQLLPSQAVTDQVWLTVVGAFKWVLWGATVGLVAAVGVALFREVDQALVQILLTVFTTVAGIFAGFISGKALSDASKQ